MQLTGVYTNSQRQSKPASIYLLLGVYGNVLSSLYIKLLLDSTDLKGTQHKINKLGKFFLCKGSTKIVRGTLHCQTLL